MAPSSSQDPPQGPRKRCAIGPHLLKTPNRSINDPNLLRFAQRVNPDMRLGCTLCLECYQNLMKLYRMKMSNARKHHDKRQASTNSISDVSNSQRTSSDPSILNPPQADSSTSSDDRTRTSAAAAAKKNQRRGRSPQAPTARSTSYISDDDDANSNLSLNAVNGTRLPHIQPIPKRRQFVHINKTAMDIYLAGTTGG
ncbi:uncharacterized protein LOC110185232 [Drosophila serrata]|uniref:uncharacterized protein LOC110185232 n=1 Tax=Drosophila serrata TaxID=7274 RepID=UPI000A1D13BD|nr:uncharacterized protein LOC110185232 [Drosophila serrata]XP_020809626.1 uncharacterized protein LOC110185232 [Drosophila serrata]